MSDQLQPENTSEQPLATAGNLEAILLQLNQDQIRFLIARQDSDTDKDAALSIGLTVSQAKSWSPERKELIHQALNLMAQDGLVTALHLRKRALAEAMAVKCGGLRSGDERIRQGAATEIIEWELGKATQVNEEKGRHVDALVQFLVEMRAKVPKVNE